MGASGSRRMGCKKRGKEYQRGKNINGSRGGLNGQNKEWEGQGKVKEEDDLSQD